MSLLILFFLFLISSVYGLQNRYCQLSCDFQGGQIFTHTVCDRQNQSCGPDSRCGPNFKVIELTNYHRQFITDLHNDLRNLVALGNETRGQQPPASNMKVMTYNRELEFIAQCWANTCNGDPLIHDHCRRTKEYEHVGQNLGWIWKSIPTIDILTSIKELIMLWYDEVAIFDNKWVTNTQDRGPNFKVGHYTQMLWADTTEIGCALSFYTTKINSQTRNNILLVCNYGPGGNYFGLPIYQIGKPASNCPNGLKPNKQYPGLCGYTKKLNKKKFNIFNI